METSVQRRMRMSKDCSAPQQDGFPGPQHQRKKRGCQQQGCQRNSARWEARSGDLAVHAFVFFPLLAARPRAHGHGRPPSRRQDRDGSLVSTARLPLASRVLSWRPGWSRVCGAVVCLCLVPGSVCHCAHRPRCHLEASSAQWSALVAATSRNSQFGCPHSSPTRNSAARAMLAGCEIVLHNTKNSCKLEPADTRPRLPPRLPQLAVGGWTGKRQRGMRTRPRTTMSLLVSHGAVHELGGALPLACFAPRPARKPRCAASACVCEDGRRLELQGGAVAEHTPSLGGDRDGLLSALAVVRPREHQRSRHRAGARPRGSQVRPYARSARGPT